MVNALTASYFELFGLPESFDLDGAALSQRYRDLQRALHPDRFASASDEERRLSVQQAARVNEGHRILKSPLTRARYLLELRGIALDDTDTRVDPAFLMQQMELRERLADVDTAADPLAALSNIQDDIAALEHGCIDRLRMLFGAADADALNRARDEVRKLQFIQRLQAETADMEDRLMYATELSD